MGTATPVAAASTAAAARVQEQLGALADIPAAEWTYFASHLQLRRARRRQLLLREGEFETHIRFLLRGVCRMFCRRGDDEVNLGFDGDGRWVAAYDSLISGDPSLFSIELLTDAEFVCFDGSLLARLYQRHSCWERVGRRLLEQQWLRKVQKEREIRSLTPRERYAQLLHRCRRWIDAVPNYHIASYLGIAPETLSRLRGRGAPTRRP